MQISEATRCLGLPSSYLLSCFTVLNGKQNAQFDGQLLSGNVIERLSFAAKCHYNNRGIWVYTHTHIDEALWTVQNMTIAATPAQQGHSPSWTLIRSTRRDGRSWGQGNPLVIPFGALPDELSHVVVHLSAFVELMLLLLCA
ncbi:hypothetical protein ACLKA6_002881 [Drosophila palustris]